jgi:hypothetical protein
MNIKKLLRGSAAVILSGSFAALPLAHAGALASTIVVTPSNTQGWSTSDTRPGGAVNFIADATSPLPPSALQLTTDATTTSKAQYLHATNTPIAQVNTLGYSTKQVSAAFNGGDPSYQLPVFLDGTAASFTTFVYEPYENGTVTSNAWQTWDVTAGQFWSSRTTTGGGSCATAAGFGGAPFYTLAAIKTMCPNAVVVGYGVNIGSNNPSYNVETDKFVFNDTTYNFEQDPTYPHTKDDCKNNGWKSFTGVTFKNQGKCIDYVEDHYGAAEVDGQLTLSNPSQKIKFNIERKDDGDKNTSKSKIEYWNYDYPGGLHYTANVLCSSEDKTTHEARIMFQIPDGHPSLSGVYVVVYVKDGKPTNSSDLYGHAATADLSIATTWCKTGAGFSPTMYTVTGGNVKIH